jgi:pyridoxal phosphate enzyme (YggS family)
MAGFAMVASPDRPIAGSDSIAKNLWLVRERIEAAAKRAGRNPGSIRLVGASKTVPADRIQRAIRAGLRIVGESRVQEALPKITEIGPQEGISWHFIGRLQRRKVRSVIGVFQMIHSVDSIELADEINRRADATGLRQSILIEVNIAGEATKGGFAPQALLQNVRLIDEMPYLQVEGLMAIPPAGDPESCRIHFRQLRELARALTGESLKRCRMQELSMGMSQDFETAVEEGATLVRVGTAIFGERHV